MKPRTEKAAVLGAGTMGARIAAHLANAGVPTFLLDVVPSEVSPVEAKRGLTLASAEARNRLARAGVDAALASRPPAFFTPETARLITVGNFEDNLAWCAQADWIIEAVAENLEIKRQLLARVEAYRRAGTIVSTNTSGLGIGRIAEGRSEDFRRHFAGTHFFNPPRYLQLVELIPGPETSPEVMNTLAEFCDRRLGKGVVMAKDTPNFIANRVGMFSLMSALEHMAALGMTIEEVDACTGPAIGRPKSATFRAVDIVGLDVVGQVVRNLYQNAPSDESRKIFKLPAFMEEMLRRGWLGEKTGGGFYRRAKGSDAGADEIMALDVTKMEYRPRQKVRFASLEMGRVAANAGSDARQQLRAIVAPAMSSRHGEEGKKRKGETGKGKSGDKAAEFLWRSLRDTCVYAARRVPEITESVVDVDRAMRWGYGWELGPFEMWDALGVESIAQTLRGDGEEAPPLVVKSLESGHRTFYESGNGTTAYFDLASASPKPAPEREGVIILRTLRERGRVVESNSGASLLDLGDGVVCCEFHSKMNAIGGDIVAMVHAGLQRLAADFDAMVIANQAENFSAGANLMLLLVHAQEQEWDEIELAVRQFQDMNMAIKYAPKPVVVAPQGMALGGGCEIVLHASRVHAAAEAYIGLVEAGVGLIPAGGGTREMLVRASERAASGNDLDLSHAMRGIFETMATAKVSTSAEEARGLGFLRAADAISMNGDWLAADAKQTAVAMARAEYRPPIPATIRVLGESFIAAAKLGVHQMLRGGYISEYDALVALKLAGVMAGGPLSSPQKVPEQCILDLERETFVSLCGEKRTQERIAHTLKTGKPLRN
jgi:3-hydroxyacyl-CoA dehydrogenase